MRQLDNNAKLLLPEMAEVALSTIFWNAPWYTGTLKRAIRQSGVTRISDYRYGVVRIEDLGDPSIPAPRGTIKEFLEWWRGIYGDREQRRRPARTRKSDDRRRPYYANRADAVRKRRAARKAKVERQNITLQNFRQGRDVSDEDLRQYFSQQRLTTLAESYANRSLYYSERIDRLLSEINDMSRGTRGSHSAMMRKLAQIEKARKLYAENARKEAQLLRAMGGERPKYFPKHGYGVKLDYSLTISRGRKAAEGWALDIAKEQASTSAARQVKLADAAAKRAQRAAAKAQKAAEARSRQATFYSQFSYSRAQRAQVTINYLLRQYKIAAYRRLPFYEFLVEWLLRVGKE